MPQELWAFDFLDCISELLDNYCFNIYAASVKNSLYNGIQSALKQTSPCIRRPSLAVQFCQKL